MQTNFSQLSSLVRKDGRVSRLALSAGLGLALSATLTLPAEAFFGLMSAPRPAQPTVQAPVSVPLTTTTKPKAVARPKAPKSGPAVSTELAAKAQGPLTLIISLDKQELKLYANGNEIAQSRVSTGKAGHSTPAGVYSVIEKDRWHYSNLYDNAPMHYMNRITWSGLALHQGVVPNYPASHGCIRMPEAFANKLFGVTRMGTRVIITRGDAAPADIAHTALFVPAKPAAPATDVVAELPPISPDLHRTHPAWLKTAMLGGDTPLKVSANEAKLTDPAGDAAGQAKPLKPGPISVFVSKKEGKIFVRKGFQPVLEAKVTFADADKPVGTHVFTALATDEAAGTARWQVVSVPSSAKAPKLDAAAALDRISIPEETRAQISALMSPGASLIVSDNGLGTETGKGTDFIVQTR